MSNFQYLLKKRNSTSIQHTFYSPVVRMSNLVIKDNYFVSLKRMKTTENTADTNTIVVTYDANTNTLGAIFQECSMFL